MKAFLSEFIFDIGLLHLEQVDIFQALLPACIKTEETLFKAYRQKLKLPDYFGDNWNALEDVLRDLWWISCYRVIIIHQDLPPLPPESLSIYLDVLSNCVISWKPGEQHQLLVFFPPNVQEAIRAIANGQ
jgi:hypothetical protein